MSKIKVLFFGATAEAAGEREIEFEIKNKSAAREIFELVTEKYPKLKNHKLLFAVNQEYSDGSETIEEADELAIFTAVSGG